MKTTVISYSLTGNNEALAKMMASHLSADHISVAESGKRAMGKIVFDVLFNRVPATKVTLNGAEDSDLIIFTAPVWMGKAATPLRNLFSQLKETGPRYVYISVCGGADGPNPGLRDELTERMGTAPAAVIELHIADLLPSEPKPKRKDTMHYRLNEEEIASMVDKAMTVLDGVLQQEGSKHEE